MSLRGVRLTNFRSYPEAEFSFDPGRTVIAGPNASGKTNLLEAVFVLAVTKSFRARDRDLIRHGHNFFRLEGDFDDDTVGLGFTTENDHQQKKLTVGSSPLPLSRHIGQIPVVLFEPTDLELATGSPENRRKYLDFILCQTDHTYLTSLNSYKRALKQRNSLLSDFDIGRIKDEVFVWDLKLAESAAEVVNQRLNLIDHINSLVGQLYRAISGQEEGVTLSYVTPIKGDYAEHFMTALNHNFTRDLAAGFTTIGPHREDFRVTFKDSPVGAVASRGEIRTAVLSMKLAELAYSERVSGRSPLLLLDDVFSELDQSRRAFLIENLSDYQTIITTTDVQDLKAAKADFELISTEARIGTDRR